MQTVWKMRILIVGAAICLVGCGSSSDWHHGTWTVQSPAEGIGEDSPPERIAAVVWASMFAGGTVTIDADEITFELGGRTKSNGYVIAERVSSSEIRLVLDDDAVHRVRRTNGGIEVTVQGKGDLEGAKEAWVMLKPAKGQ